MQGTYLGCQAFLCPQIWMLNVKLSSLEAEEHLANAPAVIPRGCDQTMKPTDDVRLRGIHVVNEALQPNFVWPFILPQKESGKGSLANK